VTIRAITPEDWPTIERLFGANGACGGCWCMWWRVEKGGKTWDAAKGEPARKTMRGLVRQGKCHAVIAFEGDVPVGWCSFGPREDFPRLLRSKKLSRPDPAPWAIVCFYLPAKQRRKGLATKLLDAATKAAIAAGATAIEGYPTVPKPGQPIAGAFAWTGLPKMFEKAGYRAVRHDAGSRRVYTRSR
jgi:GNAT superfamily N-acetyltransferase